MGVENSGRQGGTSQGNGKDAASGRKLGEGGIRETQ